jgi:hypothetical protein
MGVQMFIDLYSWGADYVDGRRTRHGMLKRIQERDQKADNAHSNDAITKSETEIGALEQRQLGADELQTAVVAFHTARLLSQPCALSV